jgi:hypothetical protein
MQAAAIRWQFPAAAPVACDAGSHMKKPALGAGLIVTAQREPVRPLQHPWG